MIKGCRSIAEYAIRRWLQKHNFEMSCFTLTMNGNKGLLEDVNHDTMLLVYDGQTGDVTVEEPE